MEFLKSTSLYHYKPLDSSQKEIRLMTLHPAAEFHDPIVVSLEIVTLTEDNIPEFEALSYVWGDPTDLKAIFIESKKISQPTFCKDERFQSLKRRCLYVTRNLWEALKHLRHHQESRLLWIDAICVDQNNLTERGSQVLRMPDVYRLAGTVLVWLGPGSSNSRLAMNWIDNLGPQISVDWCVGTMVAASKDGIDPNSRQFYEQVHIDISALEAIRDLLARPWFERLWIMQEVCLAQGSIGVVCGSERISYNHLCNAVVWLRYFDLPHIHNLRHAVDRALFVVRESKTLRRYLRDVLRMARNFQCSDQRDRVYAVLNLVKEGYRPRVEPDYSKSVPEVYRDCFLEVMRETGELDLLAYCSFHSRLADAPTWVPNWSVPSEVNSMRLNNASLGSRAHAHPIGSKVLVVTGIFVAQVQACISQPSQDIPLNRAESARATTNIMSAFLGLNADRPDSREIDVLCRTLCCNEFSDAYVPPDLNLPSFREASNYIRECLRWSRNDGEEPPEPCMAYIRSLNRWRVGRSLIKTTTGLVGVAPESTEAGDSICVVLGCRSPLVLRPCGISEYLIIGECYLDTVKHGEAFLGPLPSSFTHVLNYFPHHQNHFNVWLDHDTGRTQVEDPRLGPLPAGWRIGSHDKEDALNWYVNDDTGEDAGPWDPRLEPEALRACGVDLQGFRLV